MSETGRILRIEKLSCFDGSGLRTVVFLKGCPLSCRWCSTPESQRPGTDFGVARSRCRRCFSCVEACPEKALTFEINTERFVTDTALCTDCRRCITTCPSGARQAWGYSATAEEVYREVEKDALVYFHSGGGITLSGGEPLAQPEFVAALLETCLSHGINTAIETSSQVPWKNMEKVLPYTDTLFCDLKHMDNGIHRKITGAENKRILENIRQADRSTAPFSLVIRMPVIPGLNDSQENISSLGRFCSGLDKLNQIQLLPYHRLGIETYSRMAIPYTLEETLPPDQTAMEAYLNILTRMGLPARIGS